MRVVNERAVIRSIRRTAAELAELDGRGIGAAASEVASQARRRASGTAARTVLGTSLSSMTRRAMSSLSVRADAGEVVGGVAFAVGAELGGQARPTTRMFGRYRPRGYVIGPIVDDPNRRLEDALTEQIDEALDEWGRGTRGAF